MGKQHILAHYSWNYVANIGEKILNKLQYQVKYKKDFGLKLIQQ